MWLEGNKHLKKNVRAHVHPLDFVLLVSNDYYNSFLTCSGSTGSKMVIFHKLNINCNIQKSIASA